MLAADIICKQCACKAHIGAGNQQIYIRSFILRNNLFILAQQQAGIVNGIYEP